MSEGVIAAAVSAAVLAARLESPAVATHLKARPRVRLRYGLRLPMELLGKAT